MTGPIDGPGGPRFALRGRVVTMNAARTVLDGGVVYVDAGTIVDVRPSSAQPPDGFAGAGRARYGTPALMGRLAVGAGENLTVGGRPRVFDLAHPAADPLVAGLTLSGARDRLKPPRRLRAAARRAAALRRARLRGGRRP